MRPHVSPGTMRARSSVADANAGVGSLVDTSGKGPAGDPFGSFDYGVIFAATERLQPGYPVEGRVALCKEAVDRPGAVSELLEQLGKRRIRFAVPIDLPGGKAVAALGPIERQDFVLLPLGVDRWLGDSQQLGERVGAQHVLACQDVRSAPKTAFPGCRQRHVEVVVTWRLRVGRSVVCFDAGLSLGIDDD